MSEQVHEVLRGERLDSAASSPADEFAHGDVGRRGRQRWSPGDNDEEEDEEEEADHSHDAQTPTFQHAEAIYHSEGKIG